MKRRSLLVALVIMWVLGATGCKLAVVKGNSNSVEDVGGHGGGVQLPSNGPSEPSLLQRVLPHPDQAH